MTLPILGPFLCAGLDGFAPLASPSTSTLLTGDDGDGETTSRIRRVDVASKNIDDGQKRFITRLLGGEVDPDRADGGAVVGEDG